MPAHAMGPIKRFILVNSVVSCLVMLLWASIVVTEVKFGHPWGLQSVYILSLLLCFVGFPALNWAAFRHYPERNQRRAAACAAILVLVFIYAGIIGMIELKVALGGGK